MTRRRIVLFVAGAFLLAQLVPLPRSNPAVASEVDAPEEVREVLRRACYDCHSHETRWPWYSWVAPVSWLLVYDVHEGREHMNFSDWQGYDADEREDLREEVWEEVEEGHMPPWFYLPLHAEAELEEADRRLLRAWSQGEGG